MKIPLTLSLYIARQFLFSCLLVFGVFSLLILLIDGLELIRRSHNRDIPIFLLINMTILKFPLMGQKIMPFVILIGTVLAYTKLTRSQELAIVRSAGVSVWQFLFPSVAAAFAIGLLMVTMINPLACVMLAKYEFLEGKYLHGRSSFLAISKSGLWLRQKNTEYKNFIDEDGQTSFMKDFDGETIIHANSATGDEDFTLENVIIFTFNESDTFTKRIDAASAKLLPKFWHLKDVSITMPNATSKHYEEYFLETDLSKEEIHDSFASPETISFWNLPSFIGTLKDAGFSALSHRLQWHSIILSPILYATMIFIAALFSLRPPRHGKSGLLITGSILSGFLIYFLSNLVSSLGLSGSVPIILAAWAPVVISLLVGVGFLLHFEDG